MITLMTAAALAVAARSVAPVWSAPAQVAPAVVADPRANTLLADQLADAARNAARAAPDHPRLATAQSLAILQLAHATDPNNVEVLHLLADAAEGAGDHATLKAALKAVVALDPGDLVTQVRYVELLAGESETVEGQLAIYDNGAKQAGFDPQVRSALSVFAARLLTQRGQVPEALDRYKQAVTLNDVNTDALNGQVELGADAPPQDRLTLVARSLTANPYQPSVWLTGAHLLSTAKLHDAAATWLIVAITQIRRSGYAVSPDTFVNLALELSCAHREMDFNSLMSTALQDPNLPVPILLAAYTVHAHDGVVPGRADDPLLPRIRALYAAGEKASPDNRKVLADAMMFDLVYAPDLASDLPARLDAFGKQFGASDLLYQRLKGFWLWRNKQLAAAQQQLEPLAARDPWATFGLAKIAVDANNPAGARELLTQLYEAYPTGLLALQVLNLGRNIQAHFPSNSLMNAMGAIVNALPPETLAADRAPRDVVLVTGQIVPTHADVGDPIMLQLTSVNSTAYPLAIGSAGAVHSAIGVSATVASLTQQPLGLYAVSDSPRVYRLDPHASVVQSVRLDQGPVLAAIESDPFEKHTFLATAVSGLRGGMGRFGIGLGGQQLDAGVFIVNGLDGSAAALAKSIDSAKPSQQMIDALALYQPATVGDGTQPAAAATVSEGDAAQAIVPLLSHPLAQVRAWCVLVAPQADLPDALGAAVEGAARDKDPLVRLAYAMRTYLLTADVTDTSQRNAAAERCDQAGGAETDPRVKTYWEASAKLLRFPPPQPATAPSTEPATAPTG
jgi:tetratricopeptide (TPR) repeat protein